MRRCAQLSAATSSARAVELGNARQVMNHTITYIGAPEHRVQLEVIAIGLDAEEVTISAAQQVNDEGHWLAFIKDRAGRLHKISTAEFREYLPLTDQLKEFGPKLCAWSPDDLLSKSPEFDE